MGRLLLLPSCPCIFVNEEEDVDAADIELLLKRRQPPMRVVEDIHVL